MFSNRQHYGSLFRNRQTVFGRQKARNSREFRILNQKIAFARIRHTRQRHPIHAPPTTCNESPPDHLIPKTQKTPSATSFWIFTAPTSVQYVPRRTTSNRPQTTTSREPAVESQPPATASPRMIPLPPYLRLTPNAFTTPTQPPIIERFTTTLPANPPRPPVSLPITND
jgi:hypothetical protein